MSFGRVIFPAPELPAADISQILLRRTKSLRRTQTLATSFKLVIKVDQHVSAAATIGRRADRFPTGGGKSAADVGSRHNGAWANQLILIRSSLFETRHKDLPVSMEQSGGYCRLQPMSVANILTFAEERPILR
ncbi:hypothetical protein [Ensifer sp. ZNC0028]|uniref:hypothetical protein n=1 Tax=Ensifer sp. ZNC0028 TaxID=1339236 RepID=UPI0012DFFC31|nr:hypothetical protein [Ensifer sp. ZNC0028]